MTTTTTTVTNDDGTETETVETDVEDATEYGTVSDEATGALATLVVDVTLVETSETDMRDTTTLLVEFTTPDDAGVDDNDYVALELSFGWDCNMAGVSTAVLSEHVVSGEEGEETTTVTAVGSGTAHSGCVLVATFDEPAEPAEGEEAEEQVLLKKATDYTLTVSDVPTPIYTDSET